MRNWNDCLEILRTKRKTSTIIQCNANGDEIPNGPEKGQFWKMSHTCQTGSLRACCTTRHQSWSWRIHQSWRNQSQNWIQTHQSLTSSGLESQTRIHHHHHDLLPRSRVSSCYPESSPQPRGPQCDQVGKSISHFQAPCSEEWNCIGGIVFELGMTYLT